MKVLVTGGNGFIGRHIVGDLVKRGAEVISFDLVSASSVNRLAGITYTSGTIMDPYSLSRAAKGCDGILHLAAIIGVENTEAEILRCLMVNAEGSRMVFEAAIMADVPKVLVTSSSEVFGDITREPLNENSPFNPKSGYAVAKLATEFYARGFQKDYGINFNIVRYFNIYGPGQAANFVVPRFIDSVKSNNPLPVFGDGSQVRSFCNISDAARATVDVFLCEQAENDDFNIGNPLEPISMLDLARRMVDISARNIDITLIPFEQSDREEKREIHHRIPDTSKLTETVNYVPAVSLDAGIKELLAE